MRITNNPKIFILTSMFVFITGFFAIYLLFRNNTTSIDPSSNSQNKSSVIEIDKTDSRNSEIIKEFEEDPISTGFLPE